MPSALTFRKNWNSAIFEKFSMNQNHLYFPFFPLKSIIRFRAGVVAGVQELRFLVGWLWKRQKIKTWRKKAKYKNLDHRMHSWWVFLHQLPNNRNLQCFSSSSSLSPYSPSCCCTANAADRQTNKQTNKNTSSPSSSPSCSTLLLWHCCQGCEAKIELLVSTFPAAAS